MNIHFVHLYIITLNISKRSEALFMYDALNSSERVYIP